MRVLHLLERGAVLISPSDEQKAKFEAIGPIAESEPEPEVEVVQAPVRRVHGPSPIGAIIRQFVRPQNYCLFKHRLPGRGFFFVRCRERVPARRRVSGNFMTEDEIIRSRAFDRRLAAKSLNGYHVSPNRGLSVTVREGHFRRTSL